MTGLSVKDNAPSRKTTSLTTNHLGLAATFSARQCDGSHEHVRLENGLPAKAAIFGPEIVKLFVKALSFEPDVSCFFGEDEEEDLEDAIDQAIEAGGRPISSLPVRTELARNERLTSEQIRKINQVHVNLGHISRDQMLSLFKAAGAKDSVMQYVQLRPVLSTAQASGKEESNHAKDFRFQQTCWHRYLLCGLEGNYSRLHERDMPWHELPAGDLAAWLRSRHTTF
jgi:hypothetical protein